MKNSPKKKGTCYESNFIFCNSINSCEWHVQNLHDINTNQFASHVCNVFSFFIKATDVQTARGRLTGALKVAVAPPSEDDEAVDSSLPGN